MIVDDELIAKFLSGEASPEEAMALHEWLALPANKAHFADMVSTWNKSNPSKQMKAVGKDEAWRTIRPTRNFAWPIGIAASIVIVVSFLFLLMNRSNDGEKLTVTTQDSTRRITLADRSLVTLFHGTSVEYSKEFDRQVNLISGEAFFSVAKDAGKPFVVHASFADIKVVGTEFNVIVKENGVEVGVNEGMVLMTTATDSVYLGKGAAAFVKTAEPIRKARMDENTWAYATKKLVFKDTPMAEIIDALEKTYACTISVSSENVKNCKLTATFDRDSLEKIVLLISETLNLKLEQHCQAFKLEGDGCP